jgi:hypothetical protein
MPQSTYIDVELNCWREMEDPCTALQYQDISGVRTDMGRLRNDKEAFHASHTSQFPESDGFVSSRTFPKRQCLLLRKHGKKNAVHAVTALLHGLGDRQHHARADSADSLRR